MKKYIYKILPVLFVIFFSCQEDLSTEGVSRVTYYNDIELIGEENFLVDVGSTYTEPGAVASENDTDVSENIIISGNVDTSTPGYYPVTYSIKNVDGFSKEIFRNVFVVPSDRSKSDIYVGTYTGIVSTGTHMNATEITHLGDGLYYSTDFIGGRYNIGFDYGPVYKLSGYFYVNGDGLSHGALIVNSVWGPWDVHNPTLAGTTFSHGVSSDGGTIRDVVLQKQ